MYARVTEPCPATSRARGYCGQTGSAPVIGRQRRSGWRAAVASSRRRTGATWARHGAAPARYPPRPTIGDQRVSERVERLDRFGLRRLDEHALLDDQREVDGRRMEAVVDQPLGDVERAHAGAASRSAWRWPRTRACRTARTAARTPRPSACAQVVRGQHGVLADLAQAVAAVRQMYVYARTRTPTLPWYARTRPIDVGRSPRRSSRKPSPSRGRAARAGRARACHRRRRAGTRPSPAVRRRERLVQVEVHDVEAGLRRAELAQDRVHVRAVHVGERAGARGRRRGARSMLRSNRPSVDGLVSITAAVRGPSAASQRVEVDARPRASERHRDGLEAGHRGGRGVGAVRRVRDDDLASLESPRDGGRRGSSGCRSARRARRPRAGASRPSCR